MSLFNQGPSPPIHAAVRTGALEVVRLLLDRGAAVGAKNSFVCKYMTEKKMYIHISMS